MENIWNEIIQKITEEKNPVLPVKFSDSFNDESIIAYCNTMLYKIDSFIFLVNFTSASDGSKSRLGWL